MVSPNLPSNYLSFSLAVSDLQLVVVIFVLNGCFILFQICHGTFYSFQFPGISSFYFFGYDIPSYFKVSVFNPSMWKVFCVYYYVSLFLLVIAFGVLFSCVPGNLGAGRCTWEMQSEDPRV